MTTPRFVIQTLPLALLTCLLLWGGSVMATSMAQTSVQQSSVGSSAVVPLASLPTAPVTIYLQNATDVTGVLQRVDAKGYQLLTQQGSVLTIAPKSYQGMVLDTPAEKAVAKNITTNPVMYMAAARYAFAIRQSLKSRLAAVHPYPALSCWTQGSPVVHFVVLNTGKIISPRLLATSQCAQANAVLLKTVAQLSPPVLPPDINKLMILPINYVWALPPATPPVPVAHLKPQ
jgi:hypothetical protein